MTSKLPEDWFANGPNTEGGWTAGPTEYAEMARQLVRIKGERIEEKSPTMWGNSFLMAATRIRRRELEEELIAKSPAGAKNVAATRAEDLTRARYIKSFLDPKKASSFTMEDMLKRERATAKKDMKWLAKLEVERAKKKKTPREKSPDTTWDPYWSPGGEKDRLDRIAAKAAAKREGWDPRTRKPLKRLSPAQKKYQDAHPELKERRSRSMQYDAIVAAEKRAEKKKKTPRTRRPKVKTSRSRAPTYTRWPKRTGLKRCARDSSRVRRLNSTNVVVKCCPPGRWMARTKKCRVPLVVSKHFRRSGFKKRRA